MQSNPMPVRLLFMQLLERVYMIFWLMYMMLRMIDFHLPRTNPDLHVILTNQYIKRYGN